MVKKVRKKKPLFISFALPGYKGNVLIESRHLQRGIDFLFKGHKPHSPAAKAITSNLQKVLRHGEMNWHGLILYAETMGISPGQMYSLLGNHFKKSTTRKRWVAFISPALIKLLLKKINQWGGAPNAWKWHKKYLDSWCRRTGLERFTTYSNFSDYVTAFKEATIGKRKKKKVPHHIEKEFRIP